MGMRAGCGVRVAAQVFEPEFVDAVAHLVAIDAEQLAGVRLVAVRTLEACARS